ncbi:flavodoxin family protein [Anaeroselena agilis]|uniref:Flavodoxin family protein n=1 Tax=Anaeroselena agilis TaxID=3063788 RepID=A0ABU3P055_9FIRM|nr:flavodoxin family protein [Selenomonadales bacterium 4137-cl]
MSKTIIAVNGSPRKAWNTAALLAKALEGAAAQGAATELVHLYDLDYRGCVSCFACKLKGGPGYGRCAVRDGLAPLLEKIAAADALILGSPVYFGSVTGEMRSFLERLLFPYLRYVAGDQRTLFPRVLPTAFIYTMNVDEARLKEFAWDKHLANNARVLGMIFGAHQDLFAYDTLQFDDYGRYDAPMFDPAAKAKSRAENFPRDLGRAFDLGARLAAGRDA